MEEKEGKVVQMAPTKAENSEKMSYEQLENIAHQLSEQNRQLYTKLQESNLINMFKRLDYLFKVLENEKAFDSEFINACTNEIKELMTVPNNVEQEEAEKE